MKIKLPTRTIHIWIKHVRPDLDWDYAPNLESYTHVDDYIDALIAESVPHTTCEIALETGARFTGNAYCAPEDQFVKRKGVAMAAKRAMGSTNLNREERSIVYDVIFGRRKWERKHETV